MNEKQETKDQNPPTSQDSQKKQQTIIINSTNERLKRDEWSEGAVTTLLESYESKWILRNRAKLKGQDWEDVARHVSSRSNSTKSPKTQTQCKNKIESMKKRYRSESASSDVSAWPLYSRLDLLLRGTGQLATNVATKLLQVSSNNNNNSNINHGLVLLEPSQQGIDEANQLPDPTSVANPPLIATTQNSHGSNGFDKLAKEEELETKSSDHGPNKNPLETDSSTPALYSEKDEQRCKKRRMRSENNNNKRQKKESIGIAESIRWLAEVVVRSEQTRMDTLKEIEKMRVEAEAKRGEMEIKRTEIIANTQLEIARIFASVNNKDKDVDSSLRIGRS
ncbi:trihelix transcription factor ENAP1 isoform X1 [Lathyrus oleraceus]|uniref:trihelix transcription factor ENAP1 isoform X1 n=1 Tax=Pisum sativum TaxID=3888 RepID=UPI001FC3C880|nr:trihelix transcription factor ENAP1 isoform X1 [Pisum sativum]